MGRQLSKPPQLPVPKGTLCCGKRALTNRKRPLIRLVQGSDTPVASRRAFSFRHPGTAHQRVKLKDDAIVQNLELSTSADAPGHETSLRGTRKHTDKAGGMEN